MDDGFRARKEAILSQVDKSPKGSFDAPIREFLNFLNDQDNVVTTSSCSGRISLFCLNKDESKGGEWLYVTHEPTKEDSEKVWDALQKSEGNCRLLFEPFILHCEMASLKDGQKILALAQQAGFRESGLIVASRVILNVRTTAFTMQAPLVKSLVPRALIDHMIDECHKLFAQNAARTQKFYDALKAHYTQIQPKQNGGTWWWIVKKQETKMWKTEAEKRQWYDKERAIRPRGSRMVIPLKNTAVAEEPHENDPLRIRNHSLSGLSEGEELDEEHLTELHTEAAAAAEAAMTSPRHQAAQMRNEQKARGKPDEARGEPDEARCENEGLVSDSPATELLKETVKIVLSSGEVGEEAGKLHVVSDGGDAEAAETNNPPTSSLHFRPPSAYSNDQNSILNRSSTPGASSSSSRGKSPVGKPHSCSSTCQHQDSYPRLVDVATNQDKDKNDLPELSNLSGNVETRIDANAAPPIDDDDEDPHNKGEEQLELTCTTVPIFERLRQFFDDERRKDTDVGGCGYDSGAEAFTAPSGNFVWIVPTLMTSEWKIEAERRKWYDRERLVENARHPDSTEPLKAIPLLPLAGTSDAFLSSDPPLVKLKTKSKKKTKLKNKDGLLDKIRHLLPKRGGEPRSDDRKNDEEEEHRRKEEELLKQVPVKWEMKGSVALFSPDTFKDWPPEVWRITKEFLQCRGVGINFTIEDDDFRSPKVEIMYPQDMDPWVVQEDNGVRYVFDVTKVMFSRGNIKEKIRMANFKTAADDIILDMYAGIGYWAFPLLIHAKAAHVVCCEWNPNSLEGLQMGARLNRINDRITVIPGDNTSPETDAQLSAWKFDRVVLGLLPTGEPSWPNAAKHLRTDKICYVHVHKNIYEPEEAEYVAEIVDKWIALTGRGVEVDHIERVKWYSPHIRHAVVDLRILPVQ